MLRSLSPERFKWVFPRTRDLRDLRLPVQPVQAKRFSTVLRGRALRTLYRDPLKTFEGPVGREGGKRGRETSKHQMSDEDDDDDDLRGPNRVLWFQIFSMICCK